MQASDLLGVALTTAVLIATAGASPDPHPGDIAFDAARTARTKSAYPHYASYVTVVRYRRDNHPMVRSWETIEDEHRRIVHARAISREETAHPTYPHGINVGVQIFGGTPQIFNPEQDGDAIGQLTLAVDQDFGLAIDAPHIAASTSAGEVASAAPALPIIGRTGTLARIYDVTVLDDVVEGSATLHHLRLRPLRDPHRNRLRELWIDATTSLPVRAIVEGIGNRAPLDDVSWRVDFRQVGDGTYLSRETALAPLDADGAQLDDVTISFEELSPTNALTPLQSIGLTGDVGTTDP